MARHYSTRDFFRQMPNDSAGPLFPQCGTCWSDLDFTTMKDTQPDELFAAWLALPDDKRKAMDAEFLEIFEMSCRKRALARSWIRRNPTLQEGAPAGA